MTLATWLDRAARAHPDLPAAAIGRRVAYDYAAFADAAARLAGWLRGMGVKPGDRVALFSENRPEYLEALFGVWWAGAAAAPVNAKLHGAELAWILEHAGAKLCFVGGKTAATAAEHAPAGVRLTRFGGAAYAEAKRAEPAPLAAADSDALAWLFYTSGTTGRPKGAMLSHGALTEMSLSYLAEVDRVTPRDALIHAAPLSHGSGLYALPTIARAGVNVMPESAGFDAAEAFDLAGYWRRASMFVAPTMLRRMTWSGADCDPSAFRTIVYGGGPMYVQDAIDALERFGPRLAQIYGQGEFPMTISRLSKHDIADRRHPLWREKLGSVGRPFLSTELSVRAEDGRAAAVDEVGEVCVRGPLRMTGYWNDHAATAACDLDGWLRTGDLGALDAHGYLTLRDRTRDVVISGGTNIYPREVEEALLTHPEVDEAAVIGRPDPDWGEIVVAYVVGDVSAEALDAHCGDRIARFKRPKRYRFATELPKNNYGKVLKTALRAREADADRADGAENAA